MKHFPARLLLANRAWVANRLELKTDYFSHLSKGQTPEALWIGCCDSRAPAEEITGARPGELFVHRNIANLIHTEDRSLECVLHYSLNVLHVKHVIICGHSGCGGVLAAVQGIEAEPLRSWLAPVRELVPIADRIPSGSGVSPELCSRIVRENVFRGIGVLARHSSVRQAWQAGTLSSLHGWVYSLESGTIDPVCESRAEEHLDSRLDTSSFQMVWNE